MNKRFISVILIAALLFSALSSFSAYAEDEIYGEGLPEVDPGSDPNATLIYPWSDYDAICGDFAYKILDDTTAMVVRYMGSGKDVAIPSNVDGYTVTCFGSTAFDDEMGIESITIPETVTSLQSTNISGLSTLRTIYYNAVYASCTTANPIFCVSSGFEKIVVGHGVKKICEFAFSGIGDAEIILSDTVEEIGRFAFSGSRIKKLILPDNMKKIGEFAFTGCQYLTEISTDAETINKRAFDNCQNLSKVELREGVKHIGESAFYQCESIKELDFPDTIETIGNAAFNRNNLERVHFGKNLKSIGDRAFYGCGSLSAVNFPEGLEVIDGGAFYGCGLRSVEIPAGVISIGASAFSGCRRLKTVRISDGPTAISGRMFYNCIALEQVDLPDSITQIDSWAFENCRSLTEIVIPECVDEIAQETFYGCDNLASVTAMGNITKIGENALHDTEWFNSQSGAVYFQNVFYSYRGELPENTTFEFREGTVSTAPCALRSQYNLVSVIVPDSVVSLGNGTFRGCTALKNVKLSENLSELSFTLFYGCTALEEIEIPKTVTEMAEYAFYYCTSLKEVTIPEGVTAIKQNCFRQCYALERAYIPDSVTRIGTEAFAYCYKLNSLTLGRNISNVSNDAFYKSGLYSITGYSGSYAEKYAKKQNFEFVDIEAPVPTEPATETIATEPATSATEPTTEEPVVYKLNKTSLSLKSGAKYTLKLNVGKAKWSSSDSKVATVNNGAVTALKKGTVTIKATSSNGAKLTCKVKVTTSPTLSKSSLSVKKGKTASVKITGKAASVKNVYTSAKYAKIISKPADTKIKIKGVKKGSATLKIKVNGVVLKLKVKVK